MAGPETEECVANDLLSSYIGRGGLRLDEVRSLLKLAHRRGREAGLAAIQKASTDGLQLLQGTRPAGVFLADGGWISKSPMFRSLTPAEVEQYRQHARDNDPLSENWKVLHPVCREIWTKRGLAPVGA